MKVRILLGQKMKFGADKKEGMKKKKKESEQVEKKERGVRRKERKKKGKNIIR